MKKVLFFAFALCFAGHLQAQWIYQGSSTERNIPDGKGQEFDRPFIDIKEIYFVQFAVYPNSVDPFSLGAPNVGQVWIIYHRESVVKGENGAFYIVKPYPSEADARSAAKSIKKLGIDCWYNSALTGETFTLIGTTVDDDNIKAVKTSN